MAIANKTPDGFHEILKRVKALEEVGPLNPLPLDDEPLEAQLEREVVEEFRRSDEFLGFLDPVAVQSFIMGFYSCRSWTQHHVEHLGMDLSS